MKNQLLPSLPFLGSHVVELCYQRPHINTMSHITSAEDANRCIRLFANQKQLDLRECFWVILLTNANRVLGVSEVARGTTKGVQPNPKCIFQLALLSNACAIIVVHNHPSGSLNISRNDMTETKKIKSIGECMDITLLDHIIITSEGFVSFVQERKL